MAAGSTRQRSKSDCLPGNVWVREESQTLRPSARKVALGTTESIAPAPKSSGSSTAEPPAGSSVITGTFLNGQRTRVPGDPDREVRCEDPGTHERLPTGRRSVYDNPRN